MQRLHSIQALRGLAALLVAIGHLDYYQGAADGNPTQSFAWVGVDLFFVISGFVIAYTLSPHLQNRAYVTRFAWKRFIRIFPIYWVFVGVALVATLFTGYRAGLETHYIESALLIPTKIAWQLIPVAWSLNYELLFYLISAAFLFLFRQHFFRACVAWFVVLMIAQLFVQIEPRPYFSWSMFLSSIYQVEFLFGVAVGYLFLRGHQCHGGLYLILGLAIIIGALAGGAYVIDHPKGIGHYPYFLMRCIAIGLGGALMIYGLITLEAQNKLPNIPRYAIRLGDASYVLYLAHDLFYHVAGYGVSRLALLNLADPFAMNAIFVPICFALMVICSIQISERIEQPMIRRLKGKR